MGENLAGVCGVLLLQVFQLQQGRYIMVSDAQRRVTAKYRRENTKTMTFRFYPTGDDFEIYEYLEISEKQKRIL